MIRLIPLLFETFTVWWFFALAEYAEASVAIAWVVFFSCNLEVARARGQNCDRRAKLFPVAWSGVFIFATTRFIPNQLNWPALVMLSIFALVCVGSAFVWRSGQDLKYMEVYVRLLGSAAIVTYVENVDPVPDKQISIEYYSWIKALALFYLIGVTLAYVFTFALAASRTQDSKYGILEDSDDELLVS